MAVLNDLHHDSEECDPWFSQLVKAVAGEDPDLCVILGDLAHQGLESSLDSIRRHFSALPCPVYTVPGNHDCDVYGDTSLYEKVFPGRLNYVVSKSGWQLIFLDTTQGSEWKNTRISDATLSWLEETAKTLDPQLPSLVFSHFPLAPTVHMAPLNTGRVWQHLRHIQVRAAFCGHFHGQHQVILPPLVTTNVCCARDGIRGNFDGDPRKGFWLVQVDGATGAVDFRLRQFPTV